MPLIENLDLINNAPVPNEEDHHEDRIEFFSQESIKTLLLLNFPFMSKMKVQKFDFREKELHVDLKSKETGIPWTNLG